MDGIEEKSNFDLTKWILIFIIVLAGVGVTAGGIFVYQKGLNSRKTTSVKPTPALAPLPTSVLTEIPSLTETPEASPTPQVKPTVRPTVKPTLVPISLKIEILNGTGVTGEAGKAAKYLEGLGYKGIKTGNADAFAYKKTTIQIKESKKEFLADLVSALLKNYTVDEETKTLNEKETFDVIVTLGKE